MYKIRYYYSSLSKQFFLGFVALALLIRLTLFFVGGIYKQAYVAPTLLLYLIGFAICLFFGIAWKFLYFDFTEETITRHNLFLRKSTDFDLLPVRRALFSKSGVSLFYEEDKKPRFFISFHRFGAISPVGVENFMNLMKNHRVAVEQEYKVLPGFDAVSKWFARGYILLCLLILVNTFQYGLLVFLILTD